MSVCGWFGDMFAGNTICLHRDILKNVLQIKVASDDAQIGLYNDNKMLYVRSHHEMQQFARACYDARRDEECSSSDDDEDNDASG